MVDLSIYGGLFAVALVAATLLPLQSEALLAGLLIAGKQPVWMLVAVASVGNVAGSTINWAMGRSIEKLSAQTLRMMPRTRPHTGRRLDKLI